MNSEVDKFILRFCHVSNIKISGVAPGMHITAMSAILEAMAPKLEVLEIDDVEGNLKLSESQINFETLKYFSFEVGEFNDYAFQIL